MKKITIAICLLTIALLTGCTGPNYMAGSILSHEISNTEAVLYLEEIESMYDDLILEEDITLTDYELTEEEESELSKQIGFALTSTQFHLEDPDSMSKGIEEQLREGKKGNVDEFTISLVESAFEDLKKNAEYDVEILTKAQLDCELIYTTYRKNIKRDEDMSIVYVPITLCMKINSVKGVDSVNTYALAKKVVNDRNSSSSDINIYNTDAKETSDEEKNITDTVLENEKYQKILQKYKDAEGKYIIISKKIAALDFSESSYDIPTIFRTMTDDISFEDDLVYSKWAESYLERLFSNQVLFYDDFSSYKERITREDFCKIIVRSYEKYYGEIKQKANPFIDIDDEYVNKAYSLGIISGVKDKFFPKENLTREQCAVVISKLISITKEKFEEKNNAESYKDHDMISNWAKESVYNLKKYNLMVGENEKFTPKQELSVEQAVTIISKISENSIFSNPIAD